MTVSTWTWTGGSWTLTSGPGNAWQGPAAGDTAIVAVGTVEVGLDDFQGNTIELGGTGGAAAVLSFLANVDSNYASPGFDSATLMTSAVAGQSTPEASVLDAENTFVNDGTILADGPAGSMFTINIAGPGVLEGIFTSTDPGYFINYGTIEADAGNTLTINVGGTSELFNPGTIIANGGSVFINTASNAIAGGYAPVLGVAAIGNGGTLETNATFPAGTSGTTPTFLFLDGTSGDTLKLDHVSQTSGRVSNFQPGDTLDLGGSFAVAQLVYDANSSVLALENGGGTILASVVIGSSQSGTFAVDPSTGAAGDFVISQGADGDTLLTTTKAVPTWDNGAGTWQTAGDWSGAAVPSATSSAVIGLGSTAAFTVTTGPAPATADAILLLDPNALLQITSTTSVAPNTIQDFAGTIEVTAGNTLAGEALRMYSPSANLMLDATSVLDLAGHLNDSFANDGTIAVENGNTFAAEIDGNVLVAGGTIDAGPGNGQTGGLIAIGEDGAGTPSTVTVENGGVVTDTYAYLSSDPTSFGVLTLSGPETSWTDEVDPNDPLNSRGDMFVGYNNEVGNTPSGVTQPPYAGAAQLTVENSATLTDPRAFIGYSVDSAGAVTVQSGGVWNIGLAAGGYLDMAQGGQASLSVLAGGTVAVGNVGTFLSNGTANTGGGIGLGYIRGASGTITVSGAGALLSTLNGIGIGKGGQGILSVLNGGTVAVNAGGISVGQSAGVGSSGTVFVGGTGAAAFLNFGTAASGLTIGSVSQGTLIVADNGTINLNGTGYLGIGSAAGSVGDVEVGGTTATAIINIGTGGITVGNTGTGSLNVNSLGTVSVTNTSKLILMGQSAGAVGTITVDGATASLVGDGGIDVGWLGQGALNVENGATVTTSYLALDGQNYGQLANLSDVAALTTSGRLQATGGLYIWQGATLSVDATSGIDVGTSGTYVTGAINVENGQSIVGDGLIAAAVVNNGTIDVSSSHISTPGTMAITGPLTGAGVIDLAPGSILKLDGSLAATQSVQFGAGGAEALILDDTPGTITNSISGLNAGDQIEFAGVSTITSAGMTAPGTITVDTNLGAYVFNNVTLAAGASPQMQYYYDAGTGEWTVGLVSETENWTGAASTDLGTATNWSPSAEPTSADALNFYNDTGGTLTGTGNGAWAYFYSSTAPWILQDATLTLAGLPQAPYEPFALAENGDLTVNGGALTGDGTSRIWGGATMVVQGGAQVSFQGLQLGDQPGSEGDLLLSGAGTTWRDVDSTVPTGYGGYLYVGDASGGGVGNVTITAGAAMINAYMDIVGVDTASSGEISVTDGGSLTDAGLTIGQSGSGTLVVNGGTVQIVSGSVTVGATVDAGSSGTIIVGGAGAASSLDLGAAANRIIVGGASLGTLSVADNGTIDLNGTSGIGIGQSFGGAGLMTVDGSNAVITLGSTAGGIGVGQAGQGTLDVENGTINLNGSGGIGIGQSLGAVGLMTVDGSNAEVTVGITSGGLGVGQAGQGTLSVLNAGTISVLSAGHGINLGVSAGSAGTVTVSGTSSLLRTTFSVGVGVNGVGVMEILNGGIVSAGYGVVIGESATATGSLLVSGIGSVLLNPNTASDITVGQSGIGTMAVEDGGFVSSDAGLNIGGTEGGPDGGAGIVSLSGSSDLQASSHVFVWAGSTLSVDATSGIDVGSSGSSVDGAIHVENGHSLVGNGLIAASVVNSGLIEASSAIAPSVINTGTLEIQGAITGTGTIGIDAGASIRLDQSVSTGQTISFASGGPAELIFNTPGTGVANAITGLSAGDKIEFGNGMTIAGASVVNGNGITLNVHGSGGLPGTYDLTDVGFAPGSAPQLSWGTDATTGDAVVEVLCFLPGTLIMTPTGQTEVERLAAGDMVLTATGQTRPITWLGVGRVQAKRGHRNAATPVIIRKGALTPNVPHQDLRVTKGHSFYLDDVLIPVEFLVNHRSILWDDRAQEVSLYHIELETHDVLLANGAPAESYRDDGNRWLFQNANEGWDMAPKPPCAPVLTGGPVVDAVWRRLLDRAGPRPSVPLTNDADLHLLVNGTRIDAKTRTDDVSVFLIPPSAGEVRLGSRAAVPQELGIARDSRCLGVAVRRIAIRQGTRFRVVKPDDAMLAQGFHPFEPIAGLRWTNGDALMPPDLFAGFRGPVEVVVHLAATTRYVDDGADSRAVA